MSKEEIKSLYYELCNDQNFCKDCPVGIRAREEFVSCSRFEEEYFDDLADIVIEWDMKRKHRERLKEIADEIYKISKEEGLKGLWINVTLGGLGGGAKNITFVSEKTPFEDIHTFEDMEGWSDEDGYTFKTDYRR